MNRLTAKPIIDSLKDRKKPLPSEEVTISVVIPVKNAGEDFQNLLSLLKNQKGFKDIEIIVVDSGSTDGSLEVSEAYGAKIIKILPQEFSHSYARNLGVEHASGDYLLFTVQDALPSSDLWLHDLHSAIRNNGVVAVSCAEQPREDADLFDRAASWNHHNNFLELGEQDRITCKPDEENYFTLRKNGQLSDVACLISKEVIMKYKFMGNYAEDLDLGIRLIKDGHKLAFLSSTKVIHSHNRAAYYHLKRGYVDNLWLLKIFPDHPSENVEVKELFSSIIFAYKIVNSIVCKDLENITTPCAIKNLANIVMKTFQAATNGLDPATVNKVSNPYIDSKFISFLENVSNHRCHKGNSDSRYNGVLLGAMEGFTKIIFEYMYNTYEQVEGAVLEDFKSALYKAFAFICGAHLAACFFRSSKSANEIIREINDELNREV